MQYLWFSVICGCCHKTVQFTFQKNLVVLPPPTLYKVEIPEKFWIHPSNLVCGSGRGEGRRLVMYDFKKAQQKQACSKMFVHDCRYRRCFAHVASIYANLLVQKKAFMQE